MSYAALVGDPARSRVTVEVLDTLPEDRRAEVVDGELVDEAMTSFEHGDAQSSLAAEIKSRFGEGGPDGGSGCWIATEVTVIYAVDQGFRHDVAGWRKARVPRRPKGRRVTLRPDCVCEILSTNKRKDLVQKKRVLHGQGVPHYWIQRWVSPARAVSITERKRQPRGRLTPGGDERMTR